MKTLHFTPPPRKIDHHAEVARHLATFPRATLKVRNEDAQVRT